jgi:hypothetical protein
VSPFWTVVTILGLTVIGSAVACCLVLLVAERQEIRRKRWDREQKA